MRIFKTDRDLVLVLVLVLAESDQGCFGAWGGIEQGAGALEAEAQVNKAKLI